MTRSHALTDDELINLLEQIDEREFEIVTLDEEYEFDEYDEDF